MKKFVRMFLGCFLFVLFTWNNSLSGETGPEGFKPGGYIQTRFENFKDPKKVDGFRVKSVTLSLTGKVADAISCKAELDAGKTDGKILNEASVKITSFDFANLTLGQFKIPFSEEFITSSSAIETIERSLPVTGLSHERDNGVMLDANLFNKSFYYAAGVFNGAGQNTVEDTEGKDAVGRIVISPFAGDKDSSLKGLAFGGSFMTGNEMEQTDTYDTTVIDTKTGMFKKTVLKEPYKRVRSGALLKYTAGNFKVQGEYITQKKDYGELSSISDVSSKGLYACTAYRIPVGSAKMALQPVVKYETYDPNKDNANDTQKITTFGLNWFLNDVTKLMLDYRVRKDDAGNNKYNEFIAQAQVKI